MGFPVRVIATSDIDLCCSAFRATWADDRTAVGRGAILAKSGLATRCSMGRRPVVSGVGDGEGLSCRESAADLTSKLQSNPTRRRQFPSTVPAGRRLGHPWLLQQVTSTLMM